MTAKKISDALRSGSVDEASRVRRIAARHGIAEDGLVEFVAEIRRQSRQRRNRLSDNQIEALVARLGATQ
jgi:hypothetical protein